MLLQSLKMELFGIRPPNEEQYQRDLQKALPYAETRHGTYMYRSSKLVYSTGRHTNTQTKIQTYHATCHIDSNIGSIYALMQAMRPKTYRPLC